MDLNNAFATPVSGVATTPERELSADLYRSLAAVLIVAGHWLAASVTFRDGKFGNDNPLAVLPWTQWLTWIFQVVPVFFLVGGYASAASWTRWLNCGGRRWADWVRHRLGAVLGPTTMYVVVGLAVVAVLSWTPVAGPSWRSPAVALHLWFVPVYLVVLSLTPLAVAAHRRCGLAVAGALGVAVAAVDAARLGAQVPVIGWMNYVLCWATVYQLGIAWHGQALTGRRPVVLAAGAAIVLTVLIGLGVYPVSMVGVAGATVQNTSPPTVAMLAFAVTQAGVLISASRALTGRLRRSRWRPALAAANRNVMALYLWHMVPVVIVALIGYPTGLLPQPAPGTGAWWLLRLAWVLILSPVTALELALLWLGRRAFNRALPTITIPMPAWCALPLLALGSGWCCCRCGALRPTGSPQTGGSRW
jgi:surface polysaccharide O-acyltransferase-like enzyme